MKAKADLRDKIEAICLEFPRYGYRRVTHHMKHEGCQVNHKKVQVLESKSLISLAAGPVSKCFPTRISGSGSLLRLPSTAY